MEIGSLFKKIRISKNIKTRNVYTGVMDSSNYWRFEQGYISPSADTFIKLLAKINISLEEFIFEDEEKTITKHKIPSVIEYEDVYEYLHICCSNQKTKEIDSIITKASDLFEKNKQLRFKHLATIAKIEKKKILNKNIQEVDINIIKQYLMKCEKWNYYEFYLFNNSVEILELDCSLYLFFNRSKKMKRQINNLRVQEEYISVAITIILLCLKNNKLKEAILTKNVINQQEINEKSAHIRVLILWVDIMLLFSQNDIEKAKIKLISLSAVLNGIEMDSTRIMIMKRTKEILNDVHWRKFSFILHE